MNHEENKEYMRKIARVCRDMKAECSPYYDEKFHEAIEYSLVLYELTEETEEGKDV